jgi:hypothetical protein
MRENEYIARAANYIQRAEAAHNEAERQAWLLLAEGWLLISRYEEKQKSRGPGRLPTKDDIRQVVAKVLKLPELIRPK